MQASRSLSASSWLGCGGRPQWTPERVFRTFGGGFTESAEIGNRKWTHEREPPGCNHERHKSPTPTSHHVVSVDCVSREQTPERWSEQSGLLDGEAAIGRARNRSFACCQAEYRACRSATCQVKQRLARGTSQTRMPSPASRRSQPGPVSTQIPEAISAKSSLRSSRHLDRPGGVQHSERRGRLDQYVQHDGVGHRRRSQ